MPTDISEQGLESLIETDLIAGGWLPGDATDYDRDHCLDLEHLRAFLEATQPDAAEELAEDGPTRRKFLARLEGEIARHGVIHVLRHGVQHGPLSIDLLYPSPSPGNPAAAERYAANRFSATRQLRYSQDERALALDLALFVNGLPLATFELKNRLTKQTVEDAVEQYRRDREPAEKLFAFGRCAVHFAVDDQEVRFCTELKRTSSWFLPFNRGWRDGAGNPPNPDGVKTDYLWKRVLSRESLADILENYAQTVEERDERTGRKRRKQIWPRYHQLDAVRKLLADAREAGSGRRYLIQHSAGSGKSNSIAWLTHQLVGLERDGATVFDSVVVITDRRILDKQIKNTIRQFAQVSATVGHAERSGDLRRFLAEGKKIIISTVQKFPFIVDEIHTDQRDKRFAIVIDEAHSSQGGKTASAMSAALTSSGGAAEDDETDEDLINQTMEAQVEARADARKMLDNASYFAFTATPKNKTLEIFGVPTPEGKRRPFHGYSMKQAIEERFILDVLKSYTPVDSYYRLVKTIEGDPEFDTKRAQKKLRSYVEGHSHAIRLKAEIMADHFLENVVGARKIGGKARAMVVTGSVDRAIEYFLAMRAYLEEIKSPYKAIVAFSGERERDGEKMTEASFNGFPSKNIEDRIQEDPYRFLICADKFQTGYDEPLLHTMYVDKALSGVKAVQTLSRLNRAHPEKHDVFVLDFLNDTDIILASFSDYYRTTVLSEETDPNKLHDLATALDGYQVYSPAEVDAVVEAFLAMPKKDARGRGVRDERLDPLLDTMAARYMEDLDEDGQIDFKGKAKAFVRTYEFLASILPYSSAGWEKRSILLTLLIPKLPAPVEEDLSRGILETVDMDSYRVEKRAALRIELPDAEGEVEPIPSFGRGRKPEPELDRLSVILEQFNERFGSIDWADGDRVRQLITEQIPARVAADEAYQNAQKHSDKQNAQVEHDRALQRVMTEILQDDTQLFKMFADNEGFRRQLRDWVFGLTYRAGASEGAALR